MLDNIITQIPFLLFFIPLIGSLLINFLPSRRFITNFTYCILLVLTILSLKIIFHINNYSDVLIVNSTNKYNVIGTEFKISLCNIFVLITILFVNFIGFTNYIHEIILSRKTNIISLKHFFSIYLLHIFSIVGIMMTTNIMHLFIFLEIYSFCIYIITMIYKKHDLKILSYKYYSNNIFGSILCMLTIFYMILYFNTSDMFIIKQQLLAISLKNNLHIFFMFLLLIASIVIRFFNTNTSVHYNTDIVGINFLSITNIFINTLIGIYLIVDIIYFVFSGYNVLKNFYIIDIILCFASIMIIYNSLLLLRKKYYDNMFNIFIRINLISFVYLFMSYFLDGNNIKLFLLFLTDFISTNILLYFFTAYISTKFGTNDICVLNNNKLLKLFFIFIITFKIFLPFGTSLHTNEIFIHYIINNKNYLLLVPYLINKAVFSFLIIKICLNNVPLKYDENRIINKKSINILGISIFLILLLILFFNIVINTLNLHIN